MNEKKVGIIGSGNWGSAIAKLVGENVQRISGYDKSVQMWVFEEMVAGKELTRIINEDHENVKYLPGIKLPMNVVAVPEIEKVVEGADVLVFVMPHEFLNKCLDKIVGVVKPGAIGVTLIKGAFFEEDRLVLISDLLSRRLGIKVCSLMGANIAKDVAMEYFSESTISGGDKEVGMSMVHLFTTEYFSVRYLPVHGVAEVCGVLKNVVAMGCGIASGNGQGSNTIAAIIRNGLLEMIRFCDEFIGANSTAEMVSRAFLESCVVADLIVTCTSGRNFRFTKQAVETGQTIVEIESSEMNGQKLQGYSTGQELKVFLERNNKKEIFPLLYSICVSSQTTLRDKDIIAAIIRAAEVSNGQ
ncbi:glycerol-3-phosphate dehydrogenase (NAD+) [Nematocida homosporus]|uniref:glycerol-3-phosphate dehydrogenase (NAD+) n=1 Tax=Nematocida homosporus TaxID=1912981 RepID=UPI0022212936|nr:glycerol-3-phosphate dehydrogenase (NAD+) [Nematocida homosporus]KAI5188057.1 glycerol-3-phosphate dehydrogenase (NAD+) [Nematocida homosporus]